MNNVLNELNMRLREICEELGVNPNDYIIIKREVNKDILDEYDDWSSVAACGEEGFTC
jgi:hypothetical protein